MKAGRLWQEWDPEREEPHGGGWAARRPPVPQRGPRGKAGGIPREVLFLPSGGFHLFGDPRGRAMNINFIKSRRPMRF